MAWDPIDIDSSADNVNAALTQRLAQNAVRRWTRRGRQASVCFDYRDPVDVGSAIRWHRYIIPAYKMLPGFDAIDITMRYKVTSVEGVKIRVGCLVRDSLTVSDTTTLTSTTDATYSETLDVTTWIDAHNADTDNMVVFFDIQSQEIAGATQTLTMSGASEWYLQVSSTGTVTSLGCYTVALASTVKGTTLAPTDMAGGPYQVMSAVTTGINRLWVWPPISEVAEDVAPLNPGYINIFGDEYDKVTLQEYARLQFWSIGLEQTASTSVPVPGRSQRGPIITDGVQTEGSTRPRYPARAVSQRPFYSEAQRLNEVHTTIHSIGPYSGTTGLDFASPTYANLKQGTWAGYPSAVWATSDTGTKVLFGVRVGDDPEFRLPTDTATRVRRSMSVRMSLMFVGGTTGESTQFEIVPKTYSAGAGAVVYTAPTKTITVTPFDGFAMSSTGIQKYMTNILLHPHCRDNSAPGSSNRNRRNNLQGMWPMSKRADLARALTTVEFDVFDPDSTNADPEVITFEVTPNLTTIYDVPAYLGGGGTPLVSAIRCFVIGWCITGKQGSTAVGV